MVIFIDLDGTLLCEGDVSQRNRDAISAVQQKGYEVVLCTARPLSRFSSLMEQMNIRYAIAGSGAVIFDRIEDKLLQSITIDRAELEKMVEIASRHDLIHLFCTGKQAYTNHTFLRDFDKISGGVEILERSVGEFFQEYKGSVIGFAPHSFKFDDLHNFYKDAIAQGFNVTGASKAIIEGGGRPRQSYYVEIAPVGISKGAGVEFILKLLGIDKKDAIAIGDGYNDVEMFRAVGTRVAMANAVEGLKKLATHHTGSYQEDGVAQFLYSL